MEPSPPFPREIEADACVSALRTVLAARTLPLWRDATTIVPTVHLDARVEAVLGRAGRAGTLVVGLEAVRVILEREGHGLATVDARGTGARPARISRLLLLADDGAERFYRAAETLTRRHAARLLTCRLDVPAATLGRAVVGRAVGVKAVLVQHKQEVAAVLRAMAGVSAAP
jgi:hypothetical protein